MDALTSLASFGTGLYGPELVLGAAAVLLFVLAAGARRRPEWHEAASWLSGLAVALAFAGLVRVAERPPAELFDGLVTIDPLSVFFRGLTLLATLVAVVLSWGSPSVPPDRRGEYYALLLVLALGMCMLSSASHLLMIYVSMETVSLCSYLLVGFDTRSRSSEAGLKYMLYGAVASGVMLFGMSLLYGLVGDLSLAGLQDVLTMHGSDVAGTAAGRWAVWAAVALTLAGFGFKIAAVPFHQWCPDAYEGAPTPFTALLSVGPKAAGFAVLTRFVWVVFSKDSEPGVAADVDVPFLVMIGVVSALTMTLGNLVAIVQDNLKRLLAYSSIAHAGYVLLGVLAGGPEGFRAVALYLAVYVVMNMGAFAVVSAVDRETGSERIEGYRGLGKRSPLLALVMVVFLVSLTGLPPTAGFIGKLYLFSALIARGGTWLWVLALIGVLNSVVSLFYYARVMKAMYLEAAPADAKPVIGRSPAGVLAVALAVPTLVLGVFWQPLADAAAWSAGWLR
jgi:NADH-quinone oxidoreductase subunit N